MKILLAVDDSKYSVAATQTVLRQADGNTEVRVLHVVEPPSHLTAGGMGGYDTALDEELREESKKGEALVARVAQELRAKGLNVGAVAVPGDPRSKIIDAAAEWHADLIVLGSHGRTGVSRFLMGSVSEAVARHAPCSVEIVRMPSATE